MKNTKADSDWSLAVKILALFKCEWCTKEEVGLNSHHFFSRRFKATRYDVNNGFCLCVACHFKAHQRSSEFTFWAVKKRGELWYSLLLIKSRKIKADVTLDILFCKQVIKRSGR